MKRIMCLFIILLTSCTSAPASPPPASTSPLPEHASPQPSVSMKSAFTYNQQCPHVCWLGINPDVTTAEEARMILGSSSQIDQTSYVKGDSGFDVEWHPGSGQSFLRVGIGIENGVAQRLNFSFLFPVKIQEFIDLMGEPDEISLREVKTSDASYIEYFVYYTSKKIVMFVLVAGENGPDSSDSISDLYLNINPDDPNAPYWMLDYKDLRQPWLGFGHLEEYLLHNTLIPTNSSAP